MCSGAIFSRIRSDRRRLARWSGRRHGRPWRFGCAVCAGRRLAGQEQKGAFECGRQGRVREPWISQGAPHGQHSISKNLQIFQFLYFRDI